MSRGGPQPPFFFKGKPMSAPQFDYRMVDMAVLKCPSCGGNDLHHGLIKIFDRDEDDEFVTLTTMKDGLTTAGRIPSQGSGNPSSRRHGLTIDFWCEACEGETFTLGIAQHKGWTNIEWINQTSSSRSS
jgi:hypothetical protein